MALAELTDSPQLGALGLVEVKLTAKEELVLSKPAEVDFVRIKPSGQAYLSHPFYTQRFNEAFGRLGWTIAPCAKPMKSDRGVIVPYLLYIHGQPAAYAMGEQDYFESNSEQTYGDAVEATVASALRRFAKRLGVCLEMWDKPWLDQYVYEHCVRVKVMKWNGRDQQEKPSFQWRRKVDAPFPKEIGAAHFNPNEEQDAEHTQRRASSAPEGGWQSRRQDAAPQAAPQKRPYMGASGGNVITEKQANRLKAIIRNSGRIPTDVTEWIKGKYGYARAEAVSWKDYDAICNAIESQDPLPK